MVLPTMRGIAVELALPQLVAEDDRLRRRGAGFGLDEGAAEDRLDADDAEVVARDDHALERLAAFVIDQEIERPGVGGDRVEGGRLLLPFHPLRGGPEPRVQQRLAIGPHRRHQHQARRLLVWRRRQEDALDQAEDRRGRADAQREREHGDDHEPGMLQEQAGAEAQVAEHSSSVSLDGRAPPFVMEGRTKKGRRIDAPAFGLSGRPSGRLVAVTAAAGSSSTSPSRGACPARS